MRKRERIRLVFTPQWEGIIKTYAIKYIKENRWRCDRMHSFQDLLQEAWIIFDRCATRYPRVVDPPHFLALFKTALRNYFHDHARYTKKHVDEFPCDVSTVYADRIGELSNEGYLRCLLKDAPEELLIAFKALSKPDENRGWQRKLQPRENLNMRLRRLTGFDRMKLDEHRNYDFKEALDGLFV